MSTAKARRLKKVFADRWKYGVKRELLVINILNIVLPPRFIAMFSGVGSGIAGYLDESFDNPVNAFDIIVVDREKLSIEAFLEVTGVNRVSDYDKGKGLCVGSWKVWKAERFGITDRTWYVHVLTDRVSLRFISYNKLKKCAAFTTLNEGYGVTGKFYCCDQKHWGSIKDFLKWLKAKVI